MAQRRIYCDKTELVLTVVGKNRVNMLNISYDTISRIQFDKCDERKFLFLKAPSEKITIVTSKHSQPIVYTKSNEKKYFEDYKKELEKFAKDNRITFANNL